MKNKHHNISKISGFTLMELLIVVMIIGLLSSVVMPVLKPQISNNVQELNNISNLVEKVKKQAKGFNKKLILKINNSSQSYEIFEPYSSEDNKISPVEALSEGHIKGLQNINIKLYAPVVFMEPFDEGISILIHPDGRTPAMTFTSGNQKLSYNGSTEKPTWSKLTEDRDA